MKRGRGRGLADKATKRDITRYNEANRNTAVKSYKTRALYCTRIYLLLTSRADVVRLPKFAYNASQSLDDYGRYYTRTFFSPLYSSYDFKADSQGSE
jgi:hypothetical protein